MKQNRVLTLSFCALLSTLLTSCHFGRGKQVEPTPKPLAPYETFVTKSAAGYPTTMSCFTDDELLKKATPQSVIYICLSQQRGRLYVDNQVAMDWPVSTGTYGHETPTGKFRVLSKDADHISASYGNLYNAEGRCIDRNATPATPVPEGGSYKGSPMPYFLQLTSDGVGIHTGKVRAGRRLSHGCIRTPNTIAKKLFSIARVGTPAVICDKVEAAYPRIEAKAPAQSENGTQQADGSRRNHHP